MKFLLTSSSNLWHFGDSWIKIQPENKVFSISYLHSVGIRQPWNGYELRKDILSILIKIK